MAARRRGLTVRVADNFVVNFNKANWFIELENWFWTSKQRVFSSPCKPVLQVLPILAFWQNLTGVDCKESISESCTHQIRVYMPRQQRYEPILV